MELYQYEQTEPVRLDRFIQEKQPMLNYSQLCRFLRENKIKLNGKKQPLSTRLKKGDQITLYLPQQEKPLRVIFEDDRMVVLCKPAGLQTLDRENPDSDTLEKRLQDYCRKKDGNGEQARVCHRLDTGTEGLVLAAKDKETEAFLTDLIRDRKIKKEYLCVTFGRPPQKKALLTDYLAKDAEKGRVRVFHQPCKNAKKIETAYTVQAQSGRLALLLVELLTGRTHQIRAHLASIGCPILGDSKYGNNEANRAYRFKHQALCAWRLTFPTNLPEIWKQYEKQVFTMPKPWYCKQVAEQTIS